MSDATIPLFPLGTVLFPGQLLPLHIFEPRYRQLVTDLLAHRGDGPTARSFGVIAIREGHEVGSDAVRSLATTGTLAVLQTVEPYDDGRFDLVALGSRRFRLDRLDESAPYVNAEVTWVPEQEGSDAAVLAASAASRFHDYRTQLVQSGFIEPLDDESLPADPGALSYLIAQGIVLDQSDRQALLDHLTDSDRLRAEISLLRREKTLAMYLPSFPAGDLARTGISLN